MTSQPRQEPFKQAPRGTISQRAAHDEFALCEPAARRPVFVTPGKACKKNRGDCSNAYASFSSRTNSSECCWNQSIHSIVHEAHGAEFRARLAVKLSVVQYIRGLERKHQVELFVDGEAPSDTGVDIGSPGQPKISLGLRLVPDPVEIRDDSSVSAGQRLTLESAEALHQS